MKRFVLLSLVLIFLISGISVSANSDGDAIAEKQFESGMEYFDRQDYGHAFSYFQISGDIKGYAPAQNMLGICYRDGLGTEQDLETAKQYFQLAADQGYSAAKENLSSIEDLIKKESHVHEWIEATYTTPKTCAICGVTEGEPKPISVPKIVSVTIDEENNPVLVWEKLDEATGYKVYKSFDEDSRYSLVLTTKETSCTVHLDNMKGTTVYFKIQAKLDGSINSEYSIPVNITTNGVRPEYNISGNTLYISGDEEIKPSRYLEDWKTQKSEIEGIIIGEGAKTIANYAFSDCVNLKSVTIPNGMYSIGINAFENCKLLEYIELPESIAIIENRAFNGCDGLEKIYIPAGIREIGFEAFNSSISQVEYDGTYEQWKSLDAENNIGYEELKTRDKTVRDHYKLKGTWGEPQFVYDRTLSPFVLDEAISNCYILDMDIYPENFQKGEWHLYLQMLDGNWLRFNITVDHAYYSDKKFLFASYCTKLNYRYYFKAIALSPPEGVDCDVVDSVTFWYDSE